MLSIDRDMFFFLESALLMMVTLLATFVTLVLLVSETGRERSKHAISIAHDVREPSWGFRGFNFHYLLRRGVDFHYLLRSRSNAIMTEAL